jgi:THUMP domain-like/RNA cap guanine-N2 methyltransferase
MELDQLETLLTPYGDNLLRQAMAIRSGGHGDLRAGELLRRDHPAGLVAAALTVVDLRERARAKFDRADEMMFTRPGLEQASSQHVAAHRARRFSGSAAIADLCTGIGGDLISLAGAGGTGHRGNAGHVTAVDLDEIHSRIAVHNAGVYGVASRVTAVVRDVRDTDLRGLDAVFADPARRAGGRRLSSGQSEPPLSWCLGLADHVPSVAIKAAPGLPHELVPPGWEVEFVAEGRDLKEAVLWSPAWATVRRRATVLPGGHELVPTAGPPVETRAPGRYLIDPSPAVTRAGLVEDLARDLGAWKIDPQIAFLASDAEARTPFGRTLEVHASLPWRESTIAAELRRLDVGSVDIRRRGLAGEVERARRAFRLTGTRRATVAMTRVDGRPWALICLDAGD